MCVVLFKHLSCPTDSDIGDFVTESILRPRQFTRLSLPTNTNIGDCEYHTEHIKPSFTQVWEDKPAKGANLDIAAYGVPSAEQQHIQ